MRTCGFYLDFGVRMPDRLQLAHEFMNKKNNNKLMVNEFRTLYISLCGGGGKMYIYLIKELTSPYMLVLLDCVVRIIQSFD